MSRSLYSTRSCYVLLFITLRLKLNPNVALYQQQQQFDPNQGSIIQMLQKQHRDHQDLIIHMQKERDKERDRERKELEKERREFMSQQQHQF